MKAKKLLTLAFATIMTMVALTSCDRDDDGYYYNPGGGGSDRSQSFVLSGQWNGDFGMCYYYNWGGMSYQFNSYDTDIVFYPNNYGASYGWGKEVDWYQSGPYRRIYHRINWEIVNGNIYVYYPYDRNLDCWIRDYGMTNTNFWGYFGNSNSKFNLRKIDDFYDWGFYTDDFGNYWAEDYPGWVFGSSDYAKTRNASASTEKTDSTYSIIGQSENADGTITFGNRFRN